MATLAAATIATRLKALPDWRRRGDKISREFVCPTFAEAVAFIVRIGFAAEAADHHPDIAVHYRRVRLTFWTHSEGGLTAKDFAGAAAADALAPR